MDEENKREKSNLELWAEDEVKIACARENPNRKEGEFDYGYACYESALKAFKSLCEDEHSGMNIRFTKAILNRLIDGKPLTPIEDTDDMWEEVYGRDDNSKHYQCKRMSSLFKDVKADGSVEYTDVNRFQGVNIANPHYSYHSGLIDTVMIVYGIMVFICIFEMFETRDPLYAVAAGIFGVALEICCKKDGDEK